MKVTSILRALTATAVVMAGASVTLGAGISSIGVLNPGSGGTNASAVNAISPDGQYAVGYSNAVVAVEQLDGSFIDFAGQVPVIWKAGVLTQLPLTADSFGYQRGTQTIATGVVVRPVAGKIGIAGGFLQTISPFKMQMQYYEAPLSDLGGGLWKDNNYGLAGITGPYNTARLRVDGTEGWFVAGDLSASNRDYVMGVSGPGGRTHQNGKGFNCASNSTNANAHTAGSDTGNPASAKRALYMNVNNNDEGGADQTVIPGGSKIKSEALGISPNPASVILSGYDFDANGNSQAFVWKPGDASMTLLGTLAGDNQATAIDVRLIGGDYITGGFSSDGTTERAAIWDTTGSWDSSGQAKLVSSLLSNAGLDISAWTSLTRVTTMSDDGMTVGGYGVWASDGSTRGFVATIPEPASLLLLTLGGLAMLRRNRR